MNKTTQGLFDFIEKSPTAFQAVETIKSILNAEGFSELEEGKTWSLEKGKKYYTTKNNSSIIAFRIGEDLSHYTFNMSASHLDSPCFKVKPKSMMKTDNTYVKLNVEAYGGMILSTWLDRPLSVAGRVMVKHDNRYEAKLVNVDRDLLMIPNVAPHMNRSINDGFKYNMQVDMLPLMSMDTSSDDPLTDLLASELNEDKENILSYDLFLYARDKGRVWGMNEEFIASPRLDDQQCAYCALSGFLKGSNPKSINVCACFDNEEVGSRTRQGAASTFLYDVLQRINQGLGFDDARYYEAIAGSFMVSADNAHAVHPNHAELSDPTNRVYMNKGIVIKFNAAQSYTTDGLACAIFMDLCKKAGVPYQTFTNRSDLRGGGTLGNISTSHVSVNSVDIGLAQLGMHSAYEVAGEKDIASMIAAFEELYNSHFEAENAKVISISK